ncbi:MAG: bifunctional 5,10-methylene-tetrahydrofolate dehydrogenase/5,10-methylene-tetrahydrofolate cyclohydrolase, partial [Chloroflexi bacterium]|nr:bifunctional 5,10-methylene-tetrahydrofolate dehydrogenase/5,10-methylene-tetrahydrofolate cyclohydrolase [Chloroflexota bacterium]
MTARILDGRAIAGEVRGEVRQGVDLLRLEAGVTPGLAVVLVGQDPASEVYVAAKERAARAVGIETETIRLPADCSESDLLLGIER